ncbi:hypothetical protein WOLCODRAFT_157662 [Wolfiporia cocos MD-104 SS10]|uniref:BTB domain-containing protein n=1 Tax=Wolfiporia cocos (strain MD-104) TaxID=742152 RepID=A0A2H3JE08_WOLCO|nr:hypothetical protein WOLCODRAFT_157662 [Wolfiporia cocos MD-104 SS10]
MQNTNTNSKKRRHENQRLETFASPGVDPSNETSKNAESLPTSSQQTKSPSQSNVTTSRPAKRVRTDGGPTPSTGTPATDPPAPIQSKRNRAVARSSRSEGFWELDGSVVILIHRTLFKWYRSRLTKQSRYFTELFSHPPKVSERRTNSDDGEESEISIPKSDGLIEGEMVDGCPVYKVTVVTVEEFGAVLTALDNGLVYARASPPFDVLASLLRGAYALSFSAITDFASAELREMWPNDLAYLTSETLEHAIETLALARECDLPEVRKRAYYELLKNPTFGLLPNEDDTFASDDEEDSASKLAPTLRQTDLLRLIHARGQLQQAWLRICRAPPAPSIVPCPLSNRSTPEGQGSARARCREAHKESTTQWYTGVIQGPIFDLGMSDPLRAMQDLIEMDWDGMGYCVGCVGARRDFWQEEREKLWEGLDRWLGIELDADEDDEGSVDTGGASQAPRTN